MPVSPWSCLLAGGLLLLAALAAYAVEVYAESGTHCGGLVQRELDVASTCADLYPGRERLVVGLVLAGAALLALSPFCARRRLHGSRFSWSRYGSAAAALSLLLPLCFLPFVLAADLLGSAKGLASSTGLPEGWKAVALATGVVTACLAVRRLGLSERSAFAALGLAVPLVLATLVAVANPLADFTIDSSARLPAAPLWLLASPVLALVLALVAWLQQRGWHGPAPGVGVGTALAATAVVTAVLMPQLLPAYRSAQGGGPYPRDGVDVEAWAPVLLVVSLLSVLVVAAGYRSSGRVFLNVIGDDPGGD